MNHTAYNKTRYRSPRAVPGRRSPRSPKGHAVMSSTAVVPTAAETQHSSSKKQLPLLSCLRGMADHNKGAGKLLQSALAQSVNAWRCPVIRGDIDEDRPPWDKRHHIIDRPGSNKRRNRLPSLVSPQSKSPVATNYATYHGSAGWMQSAQWSSEQQQPEQEHTAKMNCTTYSGWIRPAERHSELQQQQSHQQHGQESMQPVLFRKTSKSKAKKDTLSETPLQGQMQPVASTKSSKSKAKKDTPAETPLLSTEKNSTPQPVKADKALNSGVSTTASEATSGNELSSSSETPSSMESSPKKQEKALPHSLPPMYAHRSQATILQCTSAGQGGGSILGVKEEARTETILEVQAPASPKESKEVAKEPDSTEPDANSDNNSGIGKSSNKQNLFYARRGRGQETSERSSPSKTNLCLPVCLVPFTEEEKSVLCGFFELHDADGSRSLSLPELVAIVDDIGRAPPEGSADALHFEQLMRKADVDGSGELSFEEFTAFLAEYYQSVYARLFVENDVDNSGTVSKFEMKGLIVKLRDHGFKVRGEDIAEMFMSIDQGSDGPGDGVLDWHEFCEFMCGYRKKEFDLLKVSAGFRENELEYLQTIFEKADKDRSGQLGIKEVIDLLERTLLGSKVETQEEIDRIVTLFTRMDKDKSMSLEFLEFLRLLRVWSNNGGKQGSRQDILQVFKTTDDMIGSPKKVKNRNGAIKRAQTAVLDSGLGEESAAQVELITEQLREIAVQHDVEDGILAKQYGLTIQETRCLRESFEFCDADQSGHIDRDELTTVLKDLGCAATNVSQKTALFKVLEREEFSRDLEFPSLVKFLDAYHEACVEEILLSMKDGEAEEGVPMDRLVQAFYQIGQYLNRSQALALLQRVGGDPECQVVDRITFSKMLDVDRQDKINAWRQKCGFSESQLSAINHAFASHSEDGGSMNRDGSVLQALQLLNLEPPPDKRKKLMRALLRVDRAGGGTLTFADFLLLVRHLENEKLYARTLRERKSVSMAGLDSDTVQQFRQVFNDCEPNDEGKVRIPTIQKLFADLGLVGNPKQRRQLQDVINEVTENDNSGLEFSQFLEVLHRLEMAGLA